MLLYLIVSALVNCVCATTKVSLTSGLWTGSVIEVTDKNRTRVETFLAVSHAEPPLGKLRFQRPVRSIYRGARNATKMGSPYIQREYFAIKQNVTYTFWPSSEDCLHLNIYRPTKANNLPIIVHYFGGSFYGGYNGMFLYDPEQLVVTQNVILVTVNYRVGLLGFLY
ncbi:acetylcholinesterase-like [Tropilaelaps mercedesae]|uniref:Acetylcholinesterase-like n=1 Tax=Tropilaelaps mercedesae TaxID=418985 RepID=A0A1V9XPL2_9ACAR|nr:acetylcholinesterase-like [Tropilaelaps mercedesae]